MVGYWSRLIRDPLLDVDDRVCRLGNEVQAEIRRSCWSFSNVFHIFSHIFQSPSSPLAVKECNYIALDARIKVKD